MYLHQKRLNSWRLIPLYLKMISTVHQILILILDFSLVSACFFLGFGHKRHLLIDKLSYKQNLKSENNRNFIIIYDYKRSRSNRELRQLYEMAETGDLRLSCDNLMKSVGDIFERNTSYCYSPVEWAILQDKITVLNHFIEESLMKYAEPHHVGFDLLKLLATSIRTGKFEAFKLIREKYNGSLEFQDFLNLAVQHHASPEFLDYLLYECCLVDEINESDSEFYQSPLHTAIRFNNIEASLKFIRQRENFSSVPLQYIMLHNRMRLLNILFDETLMLDCNFKESNEENLLHMAAKYAKEPEMMNYLLQKCYNIPIDELNGHGQTALDISLKFSDPKKQKISEILILNGADIYRHSSKTPCPMEKIIASRLVNVFKFILVSRIKNETKLQEIIEKIFLFHSWSLLDQVLLLLTNQDLKIKFEEIPLAEIIKEKAHVTLDFVLAFEFIELTKADINSIVLSASVDLVRVALKYKADPEYILKLAERKKNMGTISEVEYEAITCLIN